MQETRLHLARSDFSRGRGPHAPQIVWQWLHRGGTVQPPLQPLVLPPTGRAVVWSGANRLGAHPIDERNHCTAHQSQRRTVLIVAGAGPSPPGCCRAPRLAAVPPWHHQVCSNSSKYCISPRTASCRCPARAPTAPPWPNLCAAGEPNGGSEDAGPPGAAAASAAAAAAAGSPPPAALPAPAVEEDAAESDKEWASGEEDEDEDEDEGFDGWLDHGALCGRLVGSRSSRPGRRLTEAERPADQAAGAC